LIFARVVPNLKRLGLLTPRVREASARLGISRTRIPRRRTGARPGVTMERLLVYHNPG
jgi:hypothetical protein